MTAYKLALKRILILNIIFLAAPAHGLGTKEATIALGLSRPPYVVQETSSGLEYEIIEAAFKSVGIRFRPVFVSLNRGEVLFINGEVDGVTNKYASTLVGYPSAPYIDYYNVAASLKSRNLKISNIEDLGAYSVSAFQTARQLLGPEFRKMADSNPRYREVANQDVQIEQFLKHRVDVIVGDILIIKNYQRRLKEEQGLKDEITIHDLFPTTSYVILFNDPNLRDAFNRGLAHIRKNKTYLEIIDRYSRKNKSTRVSLSNNKVRITKWNCENSHCEVLD